MVIKISFLDRCPGLADVLLQFLTRRGKGGSFPLELINNTSFFSSQVLIETAIEVIYQMTVLSVTIEKNANTIYRMVTRCSAEFIHFQ